MNLAALQQRDPYISEIVDTASQVALYSFNSTSTEWEKTSIEGSLFIYKRSASPLHGFMILNRLGLNNLVEPLTRHVEFQQQDPFLLYRNSKSIYGVWFYDKDECKRLGGKLNSYVQDILKEEQQKKTTPSLGQKEGAGGMAAGVSGPSTQGPSQVDIMQMLSKAQQEYDTGSKKTEPKPMIDNPNASATKSTDIIRPQPLKMPETEARETDEGGGDVTPGVITLAALFRTASLQQGTGTQQKPVSVAKPSADSYVGGPPDIRTQRSISMVAPHGGQHVETRKSAEEGDLPTLLKHIMSTGSMVEDIERQHIQMRVGARGEKSGPENGRVGATLIPELPDLTQPPPNHPAYRGPSPQAQPSSRSPRQTYSRPKSCSDYGSEISTEKRLPSSTGVTGIVSSAQILSGNLLPVFKAAASSPQVTAQSSELSVSQSSVSQAESSSKNLSPQALFVSRVSPKMEVESSTRQKVDPSPVSKAPLLTPADILQSSSLFQSSVVSSSTTTAASYSHDKPILPSLATASASLSTELLSPMAFTSSGSRKTPPTSAMIERSVCYEDRSVDHSRDSDQLPVAALTKEQLQQALIYLLKNDSSFVSTIHEAYLKSLHELSGGPKS